MQYINAANIHLGKLLQMKDERFSEAVDRICRVDSRYASDSYEFISDAVTYTVKKLSRNKKPRGERHVTGHELVEGVAEYAVEQFGPLAGNVLSDWGVTGGMDIGNIVYNLIGEGLLYASDDDKKEDFEGADDIISNRLAAAAKPAALSPSKSKKAPVIIE